MDLHNVTTMKTISAHTSHLIPPAQRHLYHIMLGPNILGSYYTEKEMEDAVPAFPYICCIKVYPTVYSSKEEEKSRDIT